jgi:quinol monooxygenase YgiN
MITTTVIVKVRPEKKAEFLQAMRSLQIDRMKEKGIKASEMREVEDRTGFHLTDEWETEEDRDRYCRSESFRVFLGALKTLCAEAEVNCGSFGSKG